MTREIKFKAWYNGRMYKENMTKYLSGYGCMFNWFAEPDAPLMQFTGLLDNNGVEIYEGDIISDLDYEDKLIVGSIVFRLGSFYIEWKNYPHSLLALSENICEVIGNIYENPELLETK